MGIGMTVLLFIKTKNNQNKTKNIYIINKKKLQVLLSKKGIV